MTLQASIAHVNRRSFLKGAGVGALAVTGLASPMPVLRRAWGAERATRLVSTWNAFDVLDPHVKYGVSAAAFNLNMYDNLLRYQGNPPEIVPWLAERDEPADGGRRWTFYLRRGVKFHDGSELTAEAVALQLRTPARLGDGPSGHLQTHGIDRRTDPRGRPVHG